MKTLYSTVSKRLIKLFTTSSDRKVAGLTSSSCHEFQLRQISFTATNSSTTFQTFSLLPCCYDRKHDSSHSPARKEMPTFFPSGHPRGIAKGPKENSRFSQSRPWPEPNYSFELIHFVDAWNDGGDSQSSKRWEGENGKWGHWTTLLRVPITPAPRTSLLFLELTGDELASSPPVC